MHKVDWHELDGSEPPINPPNELVDSSPQILVLLDVLPGGYGKLHQNHLSDPFRVLGQKQLQSMKLLRNTLDIIQSIDTDDELDTVEPLLELLNPLLH